MKQYTVPHFLFGEAENKKEGNENERQQLIVINLQRQIAQDR